MRWTDSSSHDERDAPAGRRRLECVALALLAFIDVGCQQPTQASRKGGLIRTVTAQTLPLRDTNGSEIGSIFVATTGGRVLNTPRLTISVTTSHGAIVDQTSLNCLLMDEFAGSGRSLSIRLAPELEFTRIDGNRAYPRVHFTNEARGGVFDGVADSVLGAPRTNALRNFVPSEDVRLADDDGHTFAALGLSVAGGPTVAFVDDSERLQAVWSVGPAGNQTVDMFDRRSKHRVHLLLMPNERPYLAVYDPTVTGAYTLNPEATALVRWRSSADELVWLSSMTPGVTAPVTLFDQRNAVVWRSGDIVHH